MYYLPTTLEILGLALLMLEVAAVIQNYRSGIFRRMSVWAVVFFIALGGLLAYSSFFGQYMLSETTQVIGIPSMAAAFVREGQGWVDYVSPFHGLAMVVNASIGFLLPQVFVWLRSRRCVEFSTR